MKTLVALPDKQFMKPVAWLCGLLLVLSPVIQARTASNIYIQEAQMALLKPVKNQKHEWQLSLLNIRPHVVHFSKNHRDKGGLIDVKQFVQLWSAGKLSKNYPVQATLYSLILRKRHPYQSMTLRLKLSHPEYSSVFNSVTYHVHTFDKNLKRKELRFKEPTLIIFGLRRIH